jgi:hypothetical protein
VRSASILKGPTIQNDSPLFFASCANSCCLHCSRAVRSAEGARNLGTSAVRHSVAAPSYAGTGFTTRTCCAKDIFQGFCCPMLLTKIEVASLFLGHCSQVGVKNCVKGRATGAPDVHRRSCDENQHSTENMVISRGGESN